MFSKPLLYEEPLFRPPSEAYSLILQATIGCSWNKCSFCEMYTQKNFRVKPEDQLFHEIERVAEKNNDIRKIFLADGNAMVLSYDKLQRILDKLNESFPKLNRVSAYAMPRDILSKTGEQLKSLYNSGLKLLYIGIETGDDELLKHIHKGETASSTVDGLVKGQEAGIRNSVMILTGLGGERYSEQHAVESARVLNKIQPHFASTLVLSFPYGENHYKAKFGGDYKKISVSGLLQELKVFIENTELDSTIFRSDHASNYLILKGVLGRDKQIFLKQIDFAKSNPEMLREEWMRGL